MMSTIRASRTILSAVATASVLGLLLWNSAARCAELRPAMAATAKAVEGSGAPEKPASNLAFQQLASLVGEWKGKQDNTEINVTYTLTANGSALMEQFRAAQDQMVTMFTVDGDHLIATHYCAAGNQPQMLTRTITEPLAKNLAFSLSRVTGMKTPRDWHNTGLTVTIEDPQHLTQVWTYEQNGKKGTNTFRFTRTR